MNIIAVNNIIVLTRGDSFSFSIPVHTSTTPLTSKDQCRVYFGLMDPRQPFEMALVKKTYDFSQFTETKSTGVFKGAEETEIYTYTVTISLSPDDTVPLLPGKYEYAVKFATRCPEGDYVKTVRPNTKFIL